MGRLDRFLLCLLFHCLQSLTLQSNSNSTVWHNSWWQQPLLCSGDLLQAWGQLWENEELIKLYCSSAICTARKKAAVKDGRVWVWLGNGEFTREGTKYCCLIYHDSVTVPKFVHVWLCTHIKSSSVGNAVSKSRFTCAFVDAIQLSPRKKSSKPRLSSVCTVSFGSAASKKSDFKHWSHCFIVENALSPKSQNMSLQSALNEPFWTILLFSLLELHDITESKYCFHAHLSCTALLIARGKTRATTLLTACSNQWMRGFKKAQYNEDHFVMETCKATHQRYKHKNRAE